MRKLSFSEKINFLTKTIYTSTKLNSTMVDLSKIKQCPECGSSNVSYKEKEDKLYCNDCGEIFAELTPEQEKKFEKVSDVI